MRKRILSMLLVFTMAITTITATSVGVVNSSAAHPDTIYATSNVHLDTVWSWDVEETTKSLIKRTLDENFALMDMFPDFSFNFEGAYRYQLIEEYYPEEFKRLQNFAADGQWKPAGSAIENGDVNSPSPEALFRNFLYGNNYFEDKLGSRNTDIFLPDCFGFGYALPSVGAHAGLNGFTTQKLSWGNTFRGESLPFDIGRWYGPDGNYILANINGNGYGDNYNAGMRGEGTPNNKLNASPVNRASILYGIYGDRGGAPTYSAAKNLTREQAENTNSNVNVVLASTDQIYKDIMAAGEENQLPQYDGELLLHTHATGGYTSRAITKRWNRRAEQVADATERALTAADWIGASEYPNDLMKEIWTNVIVHQFHDDMPGTSNSNIYQRSWNEYMVDIMRFVAEYENGVEGIASQMNTIVSSGVPVVVNNPIAADREGVVDATVTMPAGTNFVKVYDSNGSEVRSQMVKNSDGTFDIAFHANVKSLGYRTYNVVPTTAACAMPTPIDVTQTGNDYVMNNEKYTVTVNASGDISSVMDKELNKELLKNPMRLGVLGMDGVYWAAWELPMDSYWNKTPTYVSDSNVTFNVLENGPARVTLEVVRKHRNSTYTQNISLEVGGKVVGIDNVVDWQERGTLLKAVFDFNASNPTATYDLGLGVIERGNNYNNKDVTGIKAEVPHQKWADLTDTGGEFGVSIINDGKVGIDKPSNSILRLSLIYTPSGDFTWNSDGNNVHNLDGTKFGYGAAGQAVQEIGENRFSYAIYAHAGEFGGSDIQFEAEAFNQPMAAFQTTSHEGSLGKDYSFGGISNDKVIVRAIKKAERSDEIVVRFNEGAGLAQTGVEFGLGNGIASAREINASEEAIGSATVTNGKLVFDIAEYGVKSFAITLDAPTNAATRLPMESINLPYNIDAYSNNKNKNDGGINALGETYPSELLPKSGIMTVAGIDYALGNTADGENNAVKAAGQTITVPAGFNKVRLLAASVKGDKDATFKVGGNNVTLGIADYSENVAEWDILDLGLTGYIKNQTPAHFSTHRHTDGKDYVAASTYMFSYELDVTGENTVTLPNDDSIIVFAVTAVNDSARGAKLATEIHDKREKTPRVIVPTETSNNLIVGFETGDPTPFFNRADNQNGVSNLKSEIVADPADPSNKVFKISGNDNNANGGIAYFNLYKLTGADRIKVVPGTRLSYDYYAGNDLGRYTAIDFQLDNGDLRDSGSKDKNTGIPMHPGSPKTTETGKWVHVECELSENLLGKYIQDINFPYDRSADTGEFIAYLDNLKIYTPDNIWDDLLEQAENIDTTDYSADSITILNAAIAQFKAVTENAQSTDDEMLDIYDYLKRAMSSVADFNKALLVAPTSITAQSAAQLEASIAFYKAAWTNSSSTLSDTEIAAFTLNDTLSNLKYTENAYNKIDVCTPNSSERISLDRDSEGNPVNLGGIADNAMAVYRNVDFGTKGADAVTVNYAGWNTGADPYIELRVGSETGTVIGTIVIPETKTGPVDWSAYSTVTANLTKLVTGVQDLYVIFNAASDKTHVCNLKGMRFSESSGTSRLTSTEFEIDQDEKVFPEIGENVKISDFMKTLNQTVVIYDENGDRVLNGIIADGMTIVTSSGAVYTAGEKPDVGLRGDLDGNGTVNLADIVMMRNWIMEGTPSAERVAKGDLDGNNQINLADIVALRNIIMGVAQ